jgi:tRNA A37 methylthiotransferase MiaB
MEVLVEGRSDKDPEKMVGRTRTNKLGIFPGTPEMYAPGSLVEVEMREAFLWGFKGVATSVPEKAESPRVLLELQMV